MRGEHDERAVNVALHQWPPSGSPMRSAGSRLTSSPAEPPSVVRAMVSGERLELRRAAGRRRDSHDRQTDAGDGERVADTEARSTAPRCGRCQPQAPPARAQGAGYAAALEDHAGKHAARAIRRLGSWRRSISSAILSGQHAAEELGERALPVGAEDDVFAAPDVDGARGAAPRRARARRRRRADRAPRGRRSRAARRRRDAVEEAAVDEAREHLAAPFDQHALHAARRRGRRAPPPAPTVGEPTTSAPRSRAQRARSLSVVADSVYIEHRSRRRRRGAPSAACAAGGRAPPAGWRRPARPSRRSSRGSSASTVPLPTRMASCSSRSAERPAPRRRRGDPLALAASRVAMRPSRLIAHLRRHRRAAEDGRGQERPG